MGDSSIPRVVPLVCVRTDFLGLHAMKHLNKAHVQGTHFFIVRLSSIVAFRYFPACGESLLNAASDISYLISHPMYGVMSYLRWLRCVWIISAEVFH